MDVTVNFFEKLEKNSSASDIFHLLVDCAKALHPPYHQAERDLRMIKVQQRSPAFP
jgi:hypothetical protein